MIILKIKKLPHSDGLTLPRYETACSAGLDIPAAIKEGETIILKPMQRVVVPTGLCLEIEKGYEAQIRPRSGLAVKHGITVLNSPGTIDADYRGEVKIPLINLSDEDFAITRGMRIAQMVVSAIAQVHIIEATELEDSLRGEGGFGSTGV